MKRSRKILATVLLGMALLLAISVGLVYSELKKGASEDPTVWEDVIQGFEEQGPHTVGSVLFTGSSSIRLWDTLAQDMQPLTTINRGFGGAKMGDLEYYADRLINIAGIKAIVIFAGTNDVTPQASKSPDTILKGFKQVMARIRSMHQDIPVYYIAVTPSPSRWEVWSIAQEANQLFENYAQSDPHLHYLDTGPALLLDGVPNEELYRFDKLHLSETGYSVWTEIIRGRLHADLL